MTKERTGWLGQSESQGEGEGKRNDRLSGAAKTSEELAQWRRLQRKNWNILVLPKRKEWPHRHKASIWQVRQSRFAKIKGIELFVQITRS